MTFLCIKACRSWRALEVEVWSSVVCLVRNTCEMFGGLRDAQGSLCWAEIALTGPAAKTPESPALSLSTALFLSKERNTNFSVCWPYRPVCLLSLFRSWLSPCLGSESQAMNPLLSVHILLAVLHHLDRELWFATMAKANTKLLC